MRISIFLKRVKYLFRRTFLFSYVYLTKEDKVSVPQIEVYLANGCNLKCVGCTHFNPLRKGIIDRISIRLWYETWSKKILPDRVFILGGEPFLNNEISTILQDTREFFPNSDIEIVTNGILLHKQDKKVFDVMYETKVFVSISEHNQSKKYAKQIKDGVELLRNRDIPYKIRKSWHKWRLPYKINSENKPHPYQSNPKIAWKICTAKKCITLSDNLLYKCAFLANTVDAYREGVIGNEWAISQEYQPLTPNNSAEEIRWHLLKKEVPQCCLCPEKYEWATDES